MSSTHAILPPATNVATFRAHVLRLLPLDKRRMRAADKADADVVALCEEIVQSMQRAPAKVKLRLVR
jgi:hypothetical protein